MKKTADTLVLQGKREISSNWIFVPLFIILLLLGAIIPYVI
ncbi:hypothetical protein [Falsibacillus pallidus]